MIIYLLIILKVKLFMKFMLILFLIKAINLIDLKQLMEEVFIRLVVDLELELVIIEVAEIKQTTIIMKEELQMIMLAKEHQLQ